MRWQHFMIFTLSTALIFAQDNTIIHDLGQAEPKNDGELNDKHKEAFEETLLSDSSENKGNTSEKPATENYVAHEEITESFGMFDVDNVNISNSVEVTMPDQAVKNSNEVDELDDSYDINIVEISSGVVRGFPWDTENIIAFLDIPYGNYTGYFQEPTYPDPWVRTHYVQEHTSRCPHLVNDTFIGKTDCLTLSIFKPHNATNSSVFFHIYDSNFIRGSANPLRYGPEYLVAKGIILVLPNYRLGPLGFLCLQNDTAPGNAALKDLTLALNWTRENIAAFGGNPENIVVSGDGISGALAQYLALSPKSNGYINKIITESGSVLSHWAIDRNPIDTATYLADLLRENGTYDNVFEEVDLLSLVTVAKDIPFRPCIEKTPEPFLGETPWTNLNKDHVIDIIYMVGSANYAGVSKALNHNESSITQLNDDFTLFFPNDLEFEESDEMYSAADKVKSQYFGDEDINLDRLEELSLIYTDCSYLGPALRTVRPLVRAGATVFFYEFGFVGYLNRELMYLGRPVDGAVLGDMKGYLFAQNGHELEDNTKEQQMVELMTDLWISFIETGRPVIGNVTWKELKVSPPSEEEWLSIGTEVHMERGVHLDRLNLWSDIYHRHFVDRNEATNFKPYLKKIIVSILAWVTFHHNFMHV